MTVRLISRIGVLLGFVVLLVSCGRLSGESPIAGPPATAPVGDEPHTNWENPIDGVRVDSFAQADAAISAALYEPRGLGPPTDLFVGQFNAEVAALLYQTDAYGLVVVRESPPDASREVYEESQRELLDYNDKPDTHGRFEILTIRDGQQALLTVSEDGNDATIFWLEGKLEISIGGPSIGPIEAVELAKSI